MKLWHVSNFRIPLLIIATLSTIVSLFGGQFITPGQAYSGSYALNFNGTDELVWIGPGGSVQGVLGSTWKSLKTISVWVRPLGVPRAPAVGGGPGDLDPIVTTETKFFGITRGLLQVSPGVYQDGFYVWNFDGLFQYVRIPYTGGEWIHVTLIHSGGRLYGYKNGVLIGSVASGDTNTPRTDLSWSIGGSTYGGMIPKFEGQIDEVAIFGATLTQETIRDWMYREYNSDHPNWADLGAYYKMSDGTGTTLSDNSGGASSFPGTFIGTPDWVHSGAFAGPRNALEFDGLDDVVLTPGTTSLDLSSGQTFEAWVKPGNWSNGLDTPLAVKGDGLVPAINYYFGKSSGDTLLFSYDNGGRVYVPDSSGASFSNNTWYHLAYVVDVANDRVRFYRNGNLLSEVSHDFPASLPVNNHNLVLARYPSSTDGAFQGQLDEVRLWNTVRSENDIRLNMFQALTGNESGLAAYYRFDQDNHASQNILYDVTANNNNGTLTGMVPAANWVASTAFNTWIGSDTARWTDSGNWSRYVVPSATENVGVYTDTGLNTATITSTVSAGNLVVGNGAMLSVNLSGNLSVAGSAFNFGTLRQTKAASGSADVSFLNVSNYGGLTINPNSTNLGNVTVSIHGTQQCTTTLNEAVLRCFDIISENPPATGAQIAFHFWASEDPSNACTNMEAFHWNGVGWDMQTRDTGTAPWVNGRICGSTPQSVRVMGVTSFSPFVLARTSPTAITLTSFSGSSQGSNLALFLIGILALTSLLIWLRVHSLRRV